MLKKSAKGPGYQIGYTASFPTFSFPLAYFFQLLKLGRLAPNLKDRAMSLQQLSSILSNYLKITLHQNEVDLDETFGIAVFLSRVSKFVGKPYNPVGVVAS